MQLLEADTKKMLAATGIAVPDGRLCHTEHEVRAAVTELGTPVAVKSQEKRWGRGKAGLVSRCADAETAAAAFRTQQTQTSDAGGASAPCLVETWIEAGREVYLAEIIDGELGGKAVLFAGFGGVNLESTQGVQRILVPAATGPTRFHARRALFALDLAPKWSESVLALLCGLDRLFTDADARLLEINPLAFSPTAGFTALDAKLVVDDNALGRHDEFVDLYRRDAQRDPSDTLRIEHGLEYVELSGDVGLISGGAGMTMAVMDLIAARGGSARGFLDCSQNPTVEGYGKALDTLYRDPQTTAILVNVVGGGTQVDEVARVFAELLDRPSRADGTDKPIVLRLEGSNSAEAREILTDRGLPWRESLEDAVDTAVAAARRQA